MKNILVTVAFLAGVVTTPVGAAQVTYTLSGIVGGVLSGQPFNIDAVFTGVGDTTTAFDGGFYRSITLSSQTALAGGVTYVFTDPTRFFSNVNGVSGFSLASGADFLDFSASALSSYSATTSIGAVPVSLAYSTSFNTDHGVASVTSSPGLTFSASVAAVPEPASWTLMLGGFGLIGAAMRRRAPTKIGVTAR